MQFAFIVLTLLLLVVALFALQNAEPVIVRFLHWEVRASLAVVALSATLTGAVIAWLAGLIARVRRWRRRRVVPPGTSPPPPAEPPAPAARPPGPAILP